MRMGLFSRLGEGHFKGFLILIGTLRIEPIFYKWSKSFFSVGELLKLVRYHSVVSFRPKFLERLPHGLVGFHLQVPKFNEIICSSLVFLPRELHILWLFPWWTLFGLLFCWAGFIRGSLSLHPFIGLFAPCWRLFSFFCRCWAFCPILQSSFTFSTRQLL